MTASVLDGVPGLGPARRTRLLQEIGGVRALRAASLEDLRRCRGCPTRWPTAVYERPARPGRPRHRAADGRCHVRDGRPIGETGRGMSEFLVVTGHVGGRPLDDRGRPRGPRLVRDRQPARRP